MTWYNPTEGTWVVSGEFATSSILAGSGVWIEDAKGSGNLLITYTASGAKVFSSGVLQFSTLMAPAGVVTLADKGTLGSVKYHPRAFTDAEAIALATGDITVSFTLRNVFNNSPQGVWYDPSDTTTLFQDSAGTTPVTASGQPVGLMLDKSGRGNHATQPTAGSRPIYRRGDSRGVVNLLLRSSEFDNAAWVKTLLTVTPNAVNSPTGSLTADKVVVSTGTGAKFVSQSFSVSAGGQYTYSFYAKAAEYPAAGLVFVSSAFGANIIANYDLINGVANHTGGGTNVSVGITTEPNGYYRCSLSAQAISTGSTAPQLRVVDRYVSGDRLYTGDGTSGIYIWGAQLNLGSTALPYQRNDSHLGGVATGASTDLHWLQTDGVDDGMVTGSIDFTGTDKVSVFAGVRKLSDAATGLVAELSATSDLNNGSFGVLSSGNTGGLTPARNTWTTSIRGTLREFFSVTGYVSPVSSAVTARLDLSAATPAGARVDNRIDGSVKSSVTIDGPAGAGIFGNYPLYLFRRGGTTLPFNGWFYGLAITGRLTTDAETVATERYIAAKSAVVIP